MWKESRDKGAYRESVRFREVKEICRDTEISLKFLEETYSVSTLCRTTLCRTTLCRTTQNKHKLM